MDRFQSVIPSALSFGEVRIIVNISEDVIENSNVFLWDFYSPSFNQALFTTRQSEMADLARRATSVCTKFHRDRLRNDWIMTSDTR